MIVSDTIREECRWEPCRELNIVAPATAYGDISSMVSAAIYSNVFTIRIHNRLCELVSPDSQSRSAAGAFGDL